MFLWIVLNSQRIDSFIHSFVYPYSIDTHPSSTTTWTAHYVFLLYRLMKMDVIDCLLYILIRSMGRFGSSCSSSFCFLSLSPTVFSARVVKLFSFREYRKYSKISKVGCLPNNHRHNFSMLFRI